MSLRPWSPGDRAPLVALLSNVPLLVWQSGKVESQKREGHEFYQLSIISHPQTATCNLLFYLLGSCHDNCLLDSHRKTPSPLLQCGGKLTDYLWHMATYSSLLQSLHVTTAEWDSIPISCSNSAETGLPSASPYAAEWLPVLRSHACTLKSPLPCCRVPSAVFFFGVSCLFIHSYFFLH